MTDSETNWPLPGRHMATLDKAQVAGGLPHGKTRTRGPPRIEHLGIGTRTGVQPFEEIESQVIEAIVHTKPVKFGTAEFFHNAGLERRVTETGAHRDALARAKVRHPVGSLPFERPGCTRCDPLSCDNQPPRVTAGPIKPIAGSSPTRESTQQVR